MSVRLGHVIVSVADVGAALEFCERALGLPARFRDGDRYAALDAETGTIALAGPGEHPAGDGVAIGLRVDDLDAVAAQARAAGAVVVEDVVEGAHERRFTFRDPGGSAVFVAYEPLRRPGG
jgi:predicted enzyme related to lactoylglutathione lyase